MEYSAGEAMLNGDANELGPEAPVNVHELTMVFVSVPVKYS